MRSPTFGGDVLLQLTHKSICAVAKRLIRYYHREIGPFMFANHAVAFIFKSHRSTIDRQINPVFVIKNAAQYFRRQARSPGMR